MFKTTRIKLTVWYLMIIMIISIFFSCVIYQVLMNEVVRFARIQRYRIEHNTNNTLNIIEELPSPPRITDPDLINEVRQRILLMLAELNLSIFVISGGLGYILAGRTLKPIADMMDEQNRFVSDASHELRTPLTALKTSLEVNLRDKNLDLNTARQIISDNISQVNKLQSLSDGLLELAQYQKPHQKTNFKKVVLAEVINDTISKMKPLAAQKNVKINKTLKNYQIVGNKDILSNLFTILLDNAIKYSQNNMQIDIDLIKNDNKHVLIFVKDQGIGISSKDLEHIFDRFYRADRARSKTGSSGYGLGLSIAKKIVDIHKGSITVKSKVNQGSTFTVKLPVNNLS